MHLVESLVLGVVEGLTEFIPVSSTAHLTITEKVMGLTIDDPGVTAFTAIIQLGPIAAVLLFFRRDIVSLATAWGRGLVRPSARADPQWRFAWLVILGSVPIGVVGLLGKDAVGALRNLWVVAAALIAWSVVMIVAERRATQDRGERAITWRDGLLVGLAQCVALVPGVSRSGATISAGLLRGLDRTTATRLSFFLAIPAMTAAGLLETVSQFSAIGQSVGWGATIIATIVAFVVGYASIAWLLRLVAHHSIAVFTPYRIAAGLVLVIALASGALAAT